MIRGIQIVGLIVASVAVIFVMITRKKGRINARSSAFWVLFWALFILLDLYPSVVAYIAPVLALQSNMYVLIAGSVLTLFALVFILYSFISTLNEKVTRLVREHAILDRKLVKMSEVVNNNEKENRNSNSSS